MASDLPVEIALPRRPRDCDSTLAARAAAGDHAAFAALVRPHERIAYRVAAAITGWNGDAQEAVQNAHLKAYRSLRSFRAGAAFRPWLLRIVINEAHNVRRAERRHERLRLRAGERRETAAAAADEAVLAHEEVATVWRALAELSEADRLAVVLRYFEELPDEEAAALAGASVGAYRVRLVRARRRLQAVLLAAVALLAGVAVAPAAVSALGELFDVDRVPVLDRAAPDIAPAILGRRVAGDAAQASMPFPIRTIPALGPPDAVYVRDDIRGGTATVVYDAGRILLTHWPAADVKPRITIVPAGGTEEIVTVGSFRALWIAGTARGTISLVGADGGPHRELFDVAAGALLWRDGEVAYLLQGAGTKANAVQLAAQISP